MIVFIYENTILISASYVQKIYRKVKINHNDLVHFSLYEFYIYKYIN